MKKQTVWILPDNDKADNPVTWVDSASPQYTGELKGPFIEAEATIFNDARTVEFDDDAYSDSNAGCNTKTIIIDKLADIKGCKTIMSIDEQKIIKKKQPHSYIFLKKPAFDGEGNDKSSETNELDSVNISFTINGTSGVMSDGGSYSSNDIWGTFSTDGTTVDIRGAQFNRLSFFFENSNGEIITRDDGKPVAFYVLLTKGYTGDIITHESPYMEDFSGCICDDTHDPTYKVNSAVYGTGTYKYSWWVNLGGSDVSYTFDNNTHTATLQAKITHKFPVGTKIRMGISTVSSNNSGNSASIASVANMISTLPFTTDYLNYMKVKTKYNSETKKNYKMVDVNFFAADYFSKSVSIDFTNPNKDNTENVSNAYPFSDDSNPYYFPLGYYAHYKSNDDLSSFTTYDNGLKPATVGLSTYNTPAWTFLGDIRRYTRGGKLCMKGTIRYLDYMADLQPVGSEYKDYKPFEIGI